MIAINAEYALIFLISFEFVYRSAILLKKFD